MYGKMQNIFLILLEKPPLDAFNYQNRLNETTVFVLI